MKSARRTIFHEKTYCCFCRFPPPPLHLYFLNFIFSYLIEQLASTSNATFKKVTLALNETKQNYQIVEYDVSRQPCSIHVPLNQILNMLLTSFDSLPGMTDVVLSKLEGCDSSDGQTLLQTIDPVLTVLTVLSQIKCGMWKRNGIYLVEGQHHYYHDPNYAPYNKINDLMMLQIGTEPLLIIFSCMGGAGVGPPTYKMSIFFSYVLGS